MLTKSQNGHVAGHTTEICHFSGLFLVLMVCYHLPELIAATLSEAIGGVLSAASVSVLMMGREVFLLSVSSTAYFGPQPERASDGPDGSLSWTIHSKSQTWLLRYAAAHRGLLASHKERRVYSWTVLVIRQLKAMLLLLTHWPLMKHTLVSWRQPARGFKRPRETLCCRLC